MSSSKMIGLEPATYLYRVHVRSHGADLLDSVEEGSEGRE